MAVPVKVDTVQDVLEHTPNTPALLMPPANPKEASVNVHSPLAALTALCKLMICNTNFSVQKMDSGLLECRPVPPLQFLLKQVRVPQMLGHIPA